MRATDAALLAVLWSVAVLLAGSPARTQAVSSGLSVSYSFPCKPGEYLDTSTLLCGSCTQLFGQSFLPSADQLQCINCDSTAGSATSFSNGFLEISNWTEAAIAGTGKCTCAAPTAQTVVSTVEDSGRYSSRCLVCEPGSTPDAVNGVCTPPSGVLPTAANDLSFVVDTLNAAPTNAGINKQTAVQATIQNVREPSGNSPAYVIAQSQPLVQYQGPAAKQCMQALSRDGCNALANLCALQMYSSSAAACQLYDALYLKFYSNSSSLVKLSGAQSASLVARPTTTPLPWLYYQGSGYLASTDVDVSVSFSATAPPLNFVLSEYDINGTWLGMHTWTIQLQACGASVREAAKWTRFGVNYENSCSIDLTALLAQVDASGHGPRFYDPYLQQQGSAGLYPIPVKITNKVEAGIAASSQTGHVRRFFFVDTSLGTSTGASSQVLVYPSSMSLSVAIRSDRRDSIYPPVLSITYSALQNDPSNTASQPASFSVSYTNDPYASSGFWAGWQTTLIVVLILVGGPVWVWRIVLQLRKRPNEPVDIEMLVYAALAAADVFSFALVIVLLLVSLYWLVLVRLQQGVMILMLPDSELSNFYITVVLALVGQSIGLAHMLWEQINIDIFFIDWEKPRRIVAKGGTREEAAPVSCWRTLLVANEWNELQTMRMTYPAFTLAVMVFLLDGLNTQAAAYILPSGAWESYGNVQQSMLLRFGMAAAWLLVLGLGQWLWVVLIYHRYFQNPLSQYIDLLFLSNISAVILDDRFSGYYLHGRNQLQHSDVSLKELNASLLHEEEGLVANRGLISGYVGDPTLNEGQTFLIWIPAELRRRYESTLLAQVEQAAQEQRINKGMITATVRGPLRAKDSAVAARDEVAVAFKQTIDEVERNHATQVIVPTYWQRVFRLPPEAATQRAVFMHDFHDTFASALFYGREARLYVYTALLFCGIYMTVANAAVTAFIVFVVMAVVSGARAHFGEANISRKTLVDRHFLI